ncbi:MAG: hypothetical protein QM777_20670 [Pseudorhodoferax sp.]
MGLGLLGVAVGSSALSLGRARGNVVLGQPLSLAVEVRVDQPEDATAQCFRVEVFHGDTLVESSRVRLVVQAPAAGAQEAVLRIRSNAIIDEPVVGLVLHALCGQGGTRRYDFLPEFPAELKAATGAGGSRRDRPLRRLQRRRLLRPRHYRRSHRCGRRLRRRPVPRPRRRRGRQRARPRAPRLPHGRRPRLPHRNPHPRRDPRPPRPRPLLRRPRRARRA